MKDWIFSIMEQFGYIGIMFVIALENVFPPIPSELVLPFGGFMTTRTVLTVPGVILAATMGSIIGAVILYFIGRLLDVRYIIDRWGHILRLTHKDIRTAEGWFIRYGGWTVLFCRLIPVIRSLISIPAGIARMNFVTFLLFSAVGTLIWNTILVYLGAVLGESWEEILGYVDMYKNIFYLLFITIGVALIIRSLLRRK